MVLGTDPVLTDLKMYTYFLQRGIIVFKKDNKFKLNEEKILIKTVFKMILQNYHPP